MRHGFRSTINYKQRNGRYGRTLEICRQLKCNLWGTGQRSFASAARKRLQWMEPKFAGSQKGFCVLNRGKYGDNFINYVLIFSKEQFDVSPLRFCISLITFTLRWVQASSKMMNSEEVYLFCLKGCLLMYIQENILCFGIFRISFQVIS